MHHHEKVSTILSMLDEPKIQQKLKEILTPSNEGMLKFNLPENDYDFQVAVKAMNIVSSCHEFRNLLRSWYKHDSHDFKTVHDALDAIYSRYHDIIETEIPEG